MPEQDPKLTRDELDELTGEELPDRVAMSLIANLAAPATTAAAADAIADPNAVPKLGLALRDRSWWVRKNALDALVRIGEPSKSALVRTLHGDDRFARDCAVEALMTLGMPLPDSAVSKGVEP